MKQAAGLTRNEALLFLVEHGSIEQTYEQLDELEHRYGSEYEWLPDSVDPVELKEDILEADLHRGQAGEQNGPTTPDAYVEVEPDGTQREYELLGVDDTGLLHFYRYTPECVEFVQARKTDEDFDRQNIDRVNALNPKSKVEEYLYQSGVYWEEKREVKDHDFRDLPAPEFTASRNQAVGGTVILDDFQAPMRMDFGSLSEVLSSQQGENSFFVDYRPQYVELGPHDSLQKYRLNSVKKHNSSLSDRILDTVEVVDRGTEIELDSWQVDDLAREHFIESLESGTSLDSSISELLIEDYRNLRTVSWATTSDVTELENKFDIDPSSLRDELKESGLLRNEHSNDAGKLHLSEHKAENMRHEAQRFFFGQVLVEQEDEAESTEDTDQAAFDDF